MSKDPFRLPMMYITGSLFMIAAVILTHEETTTGVLPIVIGGMGCVIVWWGWILNIVRSRRQEKQVLRGIRQSVREPHFTRGMILSGRGSDYGVIVLPPSVTWTPPVCEHHHIIPVHTMPINGEELVAYLCVNPNCYEQFPVHKD